MRGQVVAQNDLAREVGPDRIEVLGDLLPQVHQRPALGEQVVALLDPVSLFGPKVQLIWPSCT